MDNFQYVGASADLKGGKVPKKSVLFERREFGIKDYGESEQRN